MNEAQESEVKLALAAELSTNKMLRDFENKFQILMNSQLKN